jgi:lipid A biosynthesis acyltransferase
VVGLLVGYVSTAVIPAAMDARMIQATTNVYLRLRSGKENQLAARMAATLEAGSPSGTGVVDREARDSVSISERTRRAYSMAIENKWSRARGLRRRGWRPTVTITGMEHLEASRARGNGSILWRMSFCSTPVVKIAMWDAGVRLVHLSKERHGATADGWVSRHLLCPLFRRAEDWYLGERVVIPWDGNPVGAMRTLLKRLSRDNAVVSMFGDSPWAHGHEVDVFDGRARFALGAPQLADKVGSTLLPVYVVSERVGHYRVVIDRPIELEDGMSREDRLRRAAEVFARRMETAIRAHPESWTYWGLFWGGSEPFLPTVVADGTPLHGATPPAGTTEPD